jgi:hypothetical protein
MGTALGSEPKQIEIPRQGIGSSTDILLSQNSELEIIIMNHLSCDLRMERFRHDRLIRPCRPPERDLFSQQMELAGNVINP